MSPEPQSRLQRGLTNRHIQLIAIGGAIGTGLFMGSGKTISVAGPSIILVYLTIGVMLFFVMRALGELLLSNLNYKSFQDFAADFLGPWAGFVSGWTYWMCWVVTGMADLIAICGYWNFWVNPTDTDHLAPLSIVLAVATLVLLLGLNLIAVRMFGELEFWFAIIKIIAIVALIIIAFVLVVIGYTYMSGTTQVTASITHLWDRPGGFFAQGWDGFLGGFQIATFAFVGVELVGATAAEAQDPRTTLPRAINNIPIRVVLFYVFALIAIMSVTPWDLVAPEVSPFVNLFKLIGVAGAASLMNFVVLTSAASSANSGLFSTSRMLYGLAHKKMAPASFGHLSRHHVPWKGLTVTIALVATSLLLLLNESVMTAFTIVTTLSAVLFMVIWSLILASYLAYRRRDPQAHASSAYKMPGGRVMCWVVFAFFLFIVYALTQESDTLTALAVTPLWFVLLGAAWLIVRRRACVDDSSTEAE